MTGWLAVLLGGSGILGVPGGVLALVMYRRTSRKLDAETGKLSIDQAHLVNEMALQLLQPMRDRITDLSGEVEQLKREIGRLTDRLQLAQRLMTDAGIPFPPIPSLESR